MNYVEIRRVLRIRKPNKMQSGRSNAKTQARMEIVGFPRPAQRGTHARRPRHVRGFLASWLAQLDGGFISRAASGVVGVLMRSLPCRFIHLEASSA